VRRSKKIVPLPTVNTTQRAASGAKAAVILLESRRRLFEAAASAYMQELDLRNAFNQARQHRKDLMRRLARLPAQQPVGRDQ
jgi:hypothetical protein